MNKRELIGSIIAETGETGIFTKALVGELTNAVFKSMTEGLKKDGQVNFTGFGTLHVVETKARKCRNPRTGEFMETPPRKVVRFRPSKRLAHDIKVS